MSSGQAGTGTDGVAELDPSWFAVAKGRVGCVLCTVRGFQQQCMRGVTSGSAAVKGYKAKEVQHATGIGACEQCGLHYDWHKPNMLGLETADNRLRDDELVRVARVVALWEQTKLASALVGKFDAKKIAAACIWLETGTQDNAEFDGDTDSDIDIGARKPFLYETPRPKTVITRNGQITPADEREGNANMFDGEELSLVELDALESCMFAPASSVHKRQASSDLFISTPAKLRITREATDARECTVPSLFNEAIVAQVSRTNAGMRHEAMGQHELDAYVEWMEQWGSGRGDEKDKADEFRTLHITWKQRCGVCWFRCDGGVASISEEEAEHSPDMCPHKGSAIWRSVMQRADVIRGKVLTKKVVEGEAVGWRASSGCWKCGLPAWRCDSFKRVSKRFFWPKVPEVACQDENLLRHVAGSVLAHFEAGAACVIAQVKERFGQENTRLESPEGINWLQDYDEWTNPECSFFALVVFELAKFGTIARRK